MLVGSCMEDHLRAMLAESVVKTGRKANVSDDRGVFHARELLVELEAKVVHRGLGVVEEHEFLYSECGKLAAEF